MTDSEAAAWTRGHAVGMKELKAAEKRWLAAADRLIAQRNYREIEANRALAEVQRLRRREPYWWALALATNAVWTVAILMGVV
jgi:molybdopterin/thiamine biosynthesis adenylyltransferase